MVDDQAKAIEALKEKYPRESETPEVDDRAIYEADDVWVAIDRAYELGRTAASGLAFGNSADRAVSISRASQGSGVGTAELVARGMWQVAIAFGTKTGAFDEETAIAVSGDDWHQYLPDAEKLIAEHSAPPAGEFTIKDFTRPRWMNTRFGGSDSNPEKRDADLVALVDALAERVERLEANSHPPIDLERVGCPPGYRVLNDGPGREVLVHGDDEECPVFETKVQAVLFAWANYEPDQA